MKIVKKIGIIYGAIGVICGIVDAAMALMALYYRTQDNDYINSLYKSCGYNNVKSNIWRYTIGLVIWPISMFRGLVAGIHYCNADV